MEVSLRSSALLAVLLVHGAVLANAARNLVFVQAIWRHGDRAPVKLPYPKDEYNETVWQRGWGGLTNIGIEQANELGEFFRMRYDSFISSQYVPSEVYIRSSDANRALSSAQAFAFGLYPVNGSFQWESGNRWQPIPIHATSPGLPDLLVKTSSAVCKHLDEIVDEEFKEQAKYYDVKYADMFKLFREETGIADFSFLNIDGIYDIGIELIHNMTAKQPQWVFMHWPQYGGQSTMEIATELRRVRMITVYNSTKKAKMMGGYVLYKWLETAKLVANGSMKNPEKMLLYSSHDSTTLSLMYAMGVANNQLLPYASTFIMEIYKNGNDYEVELVLRNDTTKPPYTLTIPHCQTPCTVQKMVEGYGNMVLTSYDEQQELCGTPVMKCNGSLMISNSLAVILLIALFQTFDRIHFC